ncbi:hypothetical protein BD769DRAFT_1555866, partial [Suillus cothurnatus]
ARLSYPSSNPGISFVRLISTSRVIAAPVPRYGSICDGESSDEHTFNSTNILYQRHQRDDALVHACRDKRYYSSRICVGWSAPPKALRRTRPISYSLMRLNICVQSNGSGLTSFPANWSDGRLDVSSHSGSEHTRRQLDLDNDTSLDLHLPRSDLVRVPQRKSLLMGCSQMWRLSWPRSEVAYLLERRVASRL